MKLSSVRRALAAVVTAGLVAAPLVVSAPADAGKPAIGEPAGQAGDRDDPQPLPRCGHQPARRRRPGRPGAGGTPQQILVALANATHVTRAIVDDTDFTVRAGLLADEIAATEPDLIGLQEVAWWRHGRSSSSTRSARPTRPMTDYDFLQMLLDALDGAGCGVRAGQHRRPCRRRGAELHRYREAPTPATSG